MSGYTAEQLAVARELSAGYSSRSSRSRNKATGRSGGGISGSSYPTRASMLRPQASSFASSGGQASGSGRFTLRGNGASRVTAPATNSRDSGRPTRETQPVNVPKGRTFASPLTNPNYSPTNVPRAQGHTPKVSDCTASATEAVGASYICGNHGNTPGVARLVHLHASPPMAADTEVTSNRRSAQFRDQIKSAPQVPGSAAAPTEGKKLDASYAATSDPPSKDMSEPDHWSSPDIPTTGSSHPGIIEVEVAEGQKAKIDTSQPVIWNWMSGESPRARPPTVFVENPESPYGDLADIFSKKPLGRRPQSAILEPIVYFDHNLPPPVVEYYQSPSEQSTNRPYNLVQGTTAEERQRPVPAELQHENCTCNRDPSTVKGLGGSRFSQGETRPLGNQNRFTGACPVHYEQIVHKLGATLSSFTL
ncbi:hypothetical protein MGG_05000 [Pyricularia oryzae 70-15]|uniref:Uncharacterized protein n=3 Tax=Pyricularia oryzae TaxID=318829 RepID=G4N3S4_PYRO7|nr:uncharacterized protein MGG_05000 [Pyricularia oryzae 70-15]EHA52697.1 hypothetical protein MGG_05000 [Pyricularia oryzae 70-15]ELQ43040.1 hypothetical protein OOU_Y34scaffold00174g5 [Pyricularia oryzae Y34]KAI7929039.1 hypothetical protein M0657_002475 [Pyricularia oryzae]